jgi:hypothetical protein
LISVFERLESHKDPGLFVFLFCFRNAAWWRARPGMLRCGHGPCSSKVTDLLHSWQIDPTWLPGWQSFEAWLGRVNF